MSPRNSSLRITMLATALTMMTVDAYAQSLTIQNTNLGPVPLSGAVTVDSDGNLQATCSGAGCSNLGQSGTPATVSLPVGPIETTQNVQTPITVDVGNTPITCVGTASPSTGVTGWVGNDLRTTDGNVSVTFANIGAHSLTATCYNASGTAGSDTVTVNVASGQPPGKIRTVVLSTVFPWARTELALTSRSGRLAFKCTTEPGKTNSTTEPLVRHCPFSRQSGRSRSAMMRPQGCTSPSHSGPSPMSFTT